MYSFMQDPDTARAMARHTFNDRFREAEAVRTARRVRPRKGWRGRGR